MSIIREQTNGRDTQVKVCGGRGSQSFLLFSCMLPPNSLIYSPTQKLIKPHCPRVFVELDVQPPVTFQRMVGGAETSLGLSCNQPYHKALQGPYPKSPNQHKLRCNRKQLIINDKNPFITYEILSFRSSLLATRNKDQISFLLYHNMFLELSYICALLYVES